MLKDGEIVGLGASSNGRSCVSHECCGHHLVMDDLIRLRSCIVDVDGRVEEGIRVARIRDGVESCIVGFLPRNLVKSNKEKYADKFAQVIELYDSSENSVKRRKSYRNKGMASFRLLEDIPLNE